MITELLKRKNKLLIFLCLFLLISCSDKKVIVGAQWTGESDFMYVKENEMKMYYGVVTSSKSAFLGGLYEVLKSKTNVVIDRLEVTKIDFNTRADGLDYCRLWGQVSKTKEECYLLVYNCQPIYSD